MKAEANLEVRTVAAEGELEPWRIPENPFEPLRRLGKRPLIAS